MSGWDQSYDFEHSDGFYSNTGTGGGDPTGNKGGGYYEVNSQDPYSSSTYPPYMTPKFSGPSDMGPGGARMDDFADEPPLLEELGINPEHIMQRTLSVLNPFRRTHLEVAADADLAGPLVFCLALGTLLLLCGKVHFNYIYGIGTIGCIGIYALLALMNVTAPVAFTIVVSTLGYCLLPMVVLSAIGVVISLQGIVGTVVSIAAVSWCSMSASKLFVTAFNMEHQRLLVAYPCFLLYGIFALITVF